MEKNLEKLYAEWRKAGADAIEGTDQRFTWDCGEKSAREDFTDYAELDEEITYEDMAELEANYEG